MKIELYHYDLLYKDVYSNTFQRMVGAIRATSRAHALTRLTEKNSNLRLGIYVAEHFTAQTANQMADELLSLQSTSAVTAHTDPSQMD